MTYVCQHTGASCYASAYLFCTSVPVTSVSTVCDVYCYSSITLPISWHCSRSTIPVALRQLGFCSSAATIRQLLQWKIHALLVECTNSRDVDASHSNFIVNANCHRNSRGQYGVLQICKSVVIELVFRNTASSSTKILNEPILPWAKSTSMPLAWHLISAKTARITACQC